MFTIEAVDDGIIGANDVHGIVTFFIMFAWMLNSQ
jgi:hypothetical protein